MHHVSHGRVSVWSETGVECDGIFFLKLSATGLVREYVLRHTLTYEKARRGGCVLCDHTPISLWPSIVWCERLHWHYQVGHVLEAPRLLAVAVHRQGILSQRLQYCNNQRAASCGGCGVPGRNRKPRGMTHLRDEVADDPAVVDAHPRPVRVEDPGDPHLHARTNVPAAGRLIGRKVHAIGIRKDACRRTQYRTTTNLEVGCAVVVHGQRLRRALALVVAAPNTCIFLIHR
jgi:hypothetical protein